MRKKEENSEQHQRDIQTLILQVKNLFWQTKTVSYMSLALCIIPSLLYGKYLLVHVLYLDLMIEKIEVVPNFWELIFLKTLYCIEPF